MKNFSILDQFQGFLKTPDIYSEVEEGNFKTFEFPQVIITDELIADLHKIDHPRNSVLGKRMESFFEIAIQHSERYDLLKSNIQIIHEQRTLGELDFILFDKHESQAIHVELVYKLYVYDHNLLNEEARWIGPNRKDSFTEKLSKLNSRQFPLLHGSETRSYLSKLGLTSEQIEQQLCFKAQLYLPEHLNFENLVINRDCISGNWLRYSDFRKSNFQEKLFRAPKKKYWNCDPADNSQWVSYSEILKEIDLLFEKGKSPLIWMKSRNSFKRFFIVWW